MANRTAPFAAFEFQIAWRYLRARRSEGGISVMTWISLIGVTLGVMALIVTLAVRAGFRTEFVDTIVGANAHLQLYSPGRADEQGFTERGWRDYEAATARVAAVPGVTRANAVISGQAMLTAGEYSNVAEVYGITEADLRAIPRIGSGAPEAIGDLEDFDQGIAIGAGIADSLGIFLGESVKLISPNGSKTPFGTSPRVTSYKVVYIFRAGRSDIDRTRVYMPFTEAQSYFNREGRADYIEAYVDDPEMVDDFIVPLIMAGGEGSYTYTWRDAWGHFLSALAIEDDVMFIILSILVLIASINITSGMIMLVKNKGRDIGILRTMGLTEGSILRIFFLCGAFTGIIGTAMGVTLGCLIAIYIDQIMSAVNYLSGSDVWDPAVRGIYKLPAQLQAWDVGRAVTLSLTLSFIVTYFPARRAARMNPVEALRYE